MLDVAQDGGTGLIHREGQKFALMSADALQPALQRAVGLVPRRCSSRTAGSASLCPAHRSPPKAADLQDAAADMLEALREYAQDWDRLRHSPNHQRRQVLVALVDISSDEQLMDWLTAESAA